MSIYVIFKNLKLVDLHPVENFQNLSIFVQIERCKILKGFTYYLKNLKLVDLRPISKL